MKQAVVVAIIGLMLFLTGLAHAENNYKYLVVNLKTWEHRYTDLEPDLDNNICRTTELWLRRIPAGTFMMGSPKDEIGCQPWENQHEVTITRDYYLGIFECTKKQWELVMGTDENGISIVGTDEEGNPIVRDQYVPGEKGHSRPYPAGVNGDTHPRNNISYREIRGDGWPESGRIPAAASFMGKLRERTGLPFDLPTEAEWEYACRAGTTTAFNNGKNQTVEHGVDEAMTGIGRYFSNRNDGKGDFNYFTTVGSYLSNAWGLYDMHGNVSEFCLDWISARPYDEYDAFDPVGEATMVPQEEAKADDEKTRSVVKKDEEEDDDENYIQRRVVRGGSWFWIDVEFLRSASRNAIEYEEDDIKIDANGFRIGCFLQEEETTQKELVLEPGWNLVVMPKGMTDFAGICMIEELNPYVFSPRAKTYVQALVPLPYAQPLWIYNRNNERYSYSIECNAFEPVGENLNLGWQLVGVCEGETRTLTDKQITSVFSYDGKTSNYVAPQEDGSYSLPAGSYWIYRDWNIITE